METFRKGQESCNLWFACVLVGVIAYCRTLSVLENV